jgi:hypothetical protein
MRMAKIKDSGSVVRSIQHNTRERMPPNADESRTRQNPACMSTEAAAIRYRNLMPDKVRKNAVHAVEMVMTASPEFAGDWRRYLDECDTWATELFGKENLIHIAHHYDESTPHTHLVFTPLKDGKLNANHFIGGSRDRMAELQEDFYQKVGKPFSLERGQSKSETRARHSHHTLAGKTAELDEREVKLAQVEEKIKLREKVLYEFDQQFREMYGMKPADVRELKTLVANWDKATPAGLRVIARDIEQSGAATVGDYRRDREAHRKKEQSRSSSFSR